MHPIAKPILVHFWTRYKDAKDPLTVWYNIVKKATFKNFNQLRVTFPHADKVGKFVVFNIGGNKYRLITVIHFDRQKIYIRGVLTHKEYDTDKWKNE